jgi:two-component system KDP operon response regulator KdpE
MLSGEATRRYGIGVALLLLVEDDAAIRRSLIRALSDLGHAVASTGTGLGALQQVIEDQPDVVILDLGLPDIDGSEALRMLRAISQVPVIVATARDDEAIIVAAFNRGADDYVIKPYGAAHLDARIRALLRRSTSEGQSTEGAIMVGELRVDQAAREASLSGVPLELTPREFDLLGYLATRAGTVVTKRELLTQVWRQPYGGADKTVDVHISWLRRKLGESAQEPRYLRTIRGVGVKLATPGPDEPSGPSGPPRVDELTAEF